MSRMIGGQEEVIGEPEDIFSQLRSVLDYKWQIVGISVVFILVSALFVYSAQPVYRGVASVLIEYRQGGVLKDVDIYETGAGAKSYYATQVTVLGSRDMASRAVARIDWEKHEQALKVRPSSISTFKSRLVSVFPALDFLQQDIAEEPLGESAEQSALVDMFLGATKLVPVVNTQLVQVHFLSTSRELAQEGANALAEAYIDSGFDAQFEATKRAAEWLNERLVGVKAQLEVSEKNLQNFRESQDLVSIAGGRQILETELADNMQRLRDAQRQKTQLQNTYAQIRSAAYNDYLLQQVPTLLQDELVRRTKEVFLASQNEISELKTRYGSKHPAMIKAQAKFEESQSAFYTQLRRAADNVQAQYEIASRNVASLSGVVEKTRSQIRALDRQDYRLQILNRETESNSQLYNTILKRFKEADVAGDFQPLKARIIDPAILPKRPFKPNKFKSMFFAGVFGVLVGIVVALIRNYLDTGIKTGDDLEQNTGFPVFASIPVVGRRLFAGSVSRVVESHPRTPFAEGLRTVRTGILLADLEKKNKKILVTSAMPQEGKSSIATNLALAFAQVERVLIVDCDLRKPNLTKYLGVKSSSPGVGELLQGRLDKTSKAIHPVAPNLDLLPIGTELPSPGQVLTSTKFRALLDEVSADYDRVIIDSAPCQPVSDSLLLAKQVDGIVFVVRYDSTPMKLVQASLRRLARPQVPILGLVLNRIDPVRAVRAEDSSYHGKGYYG